MINDVWLFRLYQANAWAYRRAEDIRPLVYYGLGAQLLGCLAFAFAYARGYQREGSGLAQGIRFGLVIAILIDGFATVWNVVTQPIAVRLGVLELVARVGEFGIYGTLPFLVLFQIGFLYTGLLSIVQQYAGDSVVLEPVTEEEI